MFDVNLGKAPPPFASDIARHDDAMRAYLAACTSRVYRFTGADAGAAHGHQRLTSIDPQRQCFLPTSADLESRVSDCTLRHNDEIGNYIATNQGGANSANLHDDLETDILDLGADFAQHVADVAYMKQEHVTQTSRVDHKDCKASQATTQENTSSAALPGHPSENGPLTLAKTISNNTSPIVHSRLTAESNFDGDASHKGATTYKT